MNIVAISGSLRKGSYNTALLREMMKLAPAGMKIEIADISNLPMYNQDDEAAFPAEAQALKDKIENADGLILATPEFNRSISSALKNAIDWASRPYGKNSFAGRIILTAGVAYGKTGTAPAQAHLRQILLYLDADVMGQPELYLGPSADLFDANNELTRDSIKELLANALSVLAERVKK